MARCEHCGRRTVTTPADCPRDHGQLAELAPLPEAVASLPQVPGFAVERLLGWGGYGVVVKAARARDGVAVAIKVAHRGHDTATARLRREADALAAIGSPHVPALLGTGELADGSGYLVMEYLAMPTLAARMETLPAGTASLRGDALAILGALVAVHQRGLVHRDLKPENVFVDGTTARLCDFGLVKVQQPDAHRVDLTRTGTMLGTADYMAPEQCQDGRAAGPAADVYAMGVILFEMVAGRPPFFGSPPDVMLAHQSRRPPRLGELAAVSPELEAVVARCLAKQPEARFSDAAELAQALRRALEASSPAASPALRARAVQPAMQTMTLGLVFAELAGDLGRIKEAIGSFGGVLAHTAGGRLVAAFDHEASDKPASRALACASALVERGLCQRAIVDLGAVRTQTLANGTRRFVSVVFGRADRYPTASDPMAVVVTAAARQVLDGLAGDELAHRPGAIALPAATAAAANDATILRAAAPLVGRSEPLELLLEDARGAIADGAIASLVVGEPGHGKSHLCAALLERLRALAPRAEICELRGQESAGAHSQGALQQLARLVLDVAEARPPDAGRRLLRDRLGDADAQLWPAVALALGWLDADASELRELRAAPGVLRTQTARVLGEALRRRARARPVYVVADDAHFIDFTTLDVLEYASADAAPLWICAFARPALLASRQQFCERARRQRTVQLGPLDRASAVELCRELLVPATEVPATALDRLVDRTQGIPFLLVELVRGLKRDGLLRREGKGSGWVLATDELDRVPDLPFVEWLTGRELAALAPDLAAHARLVSLIGADLTPREVEGVVHQLDLAHASSEVPLDPRAGLDELIRLGLVVRHRRGTVGFRHALLRDAIARTVPEPQRLEIHRAALAYYRDTDDDLVPERRQAQVAFHAGQAGLHDAAWRAYLWLAERARLHHAYLEAELLYSRALDHGEGVDAVQRDGAHRGRGQMRYRLGRYEEALRDFGLAVELARQRGDVAAEIEALLDEATALDWIAMGAGAADFQSSRARVDRAHALAAGDATPLLEARLLLGRGRSLHRFSQEVEAAGLLRVAAATAAQLGDDGYETFVIASLMLGFILQGLDRLDEAEQALDRVIAACQSRGDLLHLVSGINNRALLWACRGARDKMLADFQRVFELARELGLVTMELIAHYNLGEYLLLMDDPARAEPSILQAVELERRRIGDEPGPSTLLLARLQFFRGDEPAARGAAERLRARSQLAPSQDVLCAMLELATRAASDAEWDDLEQRAARFSIGQERIEVVEARGIQAFRHGRTARAQDAFERALALAAQIPNGMAQRLTRQLAAASRVPAPRVEPPGPRPPPARP